MTQQQAFDILKLGHNVYLTGSAGTGKTFLLNKYIKHLQDKGVAVGVTASTGIAATHLKGISIHSWSGIGIKEKLAEHELMEMAKKRYLRNRFEQARVLIIDEVSMLHAYHLDLVDKVCRAFKESHLPFGGLQVILCGDFFQLPPISRDEQEAKFINQAEIWQNMGLKICYLDEQYRHDDAKLVKILNDIRNNEVSDETVDLLSACLSEESLEHTRLYTHNVDVDEINNRRLRGIPGLAHLYRMRFRGFKPLVETLKNSCLAPEKLYLKKGASVMFVKNNFEQGYVNGTLGVVIAFDESGFPVVKTREGDKIVAAPVSWTIEEDGVTKAEIVQIPLRLAWAITVHKSQGMTLDAAEIDLTKCFALGMGYVALSRVRKLSGIKLRGLNDLALEVSEDVLELDKELREMSARAIRVLQELDQGQKEKMQEEFLRSIAPKEAFKKPKKIPGATYEETKKLVLQKLSIKEIANRRGITAGTVMSHLEKLKDKGEELDLDYLKPSAERLDLIRKAFEMSGGRNLTPVKEILGDDFSYDELRLARLFLDEVIRF